MAERADITEYAIADKTGKPYQVLLFQFSDPQVVDRFTDEPELGQYSQQIWDLAVAAFRDQT